MDTELVKAAPTIDGFPAARIDEQSRFRELTAAVHTAGETL